MCHQTIIKPIVTLVMLTQILWQTLCLKWLLVEADINFYQCLRLISLSHTTLMSDRGVWMAACSPHGFISDGCSRSQRIMSAAAVQYTSLRNHRIAFPSGAFSALVGTSNKLHKHFLTCWFIVHTHAFFPFCSLCRTGVVVGYNAV